MKSAFEGGEWVMPMAWLVFGAITFHLISTGGWDTIFSWLFYLVPSGPGL